MASKTVITYPIEFCLLLVGVWPRSSYRIFQRIVWSVAMVFTLSSQFWYFALYWRSEDLPDLLDGLSLVFSNLVAFIKLIILWLNYGIFFNALTIVFEDWDNIALSGRNSRFMLEKALTSFHVSRSLIYIYSAAWILYSASAMMITDGTDEGSVSNQRKLLLKMKFPFEATVSPVYEVIVIAQFLLEYTAALIAAMLMALFAALVLHIGSQIDVMCQELMEIPNQRKEDRLRVFRSVVVKHQRIIYLSTNVKDLFTYISLVQFLANILVICFLGFNLVKSLGTENGSMLIAKMLPYYLATNVEAFILCYTGEYLASMSENISGTACNMDWYKLNPPEIRLVKLLLLRAQKQLTLTAGKFVNLSLETFASMLNASASYISLLLAMY